MSEYSHNYTAPDVTLPSGGMESSWIDSFLKGIPDLASGLSDFTKGLTEQASGALTTAEGEADTAIYTQYLLAFPQYETYKKGQYKTQENQTLADRLANMGMRGQSTGEAGDTTSAAAVYTGEKSMWDEGYQVLTDELALQKTEAQQKLNVAQATIKAGQTEGGVGEWQTILGAGETGAAIGSMLLPGWGTAIGAGIGAFVGWAASGFKV
jgi:hypothetical protein